jgi:hypothetical protein
MTIRTSMSDLADRFFSSVEQQDFQKFRETFDKDAVIWHNVDQAEKALFTFVDILEGVRAHASSWTYHVIRHCDFPDGFVRQNRLVGATSAGKPFDFATCVGGIVKEARLTRVEEYYDATAAQPLFELLVARA